MINAIFMTPGLIKPISLLFFLISFGIVIAQSPKKVEFDADYIEMNERISKDAKRLIGNVVFRHDGSTMYCDSAYYYSELNSLDAYSNVFVNQGDTLFMYSNKLYYNGNTKFSKAYGNVRLIDDSTTLYTEKLDFDMHSNIGFYENNGKIINNADTLYSIKGYYYNRKDLFHFMDSVVVVNKDYIGYSDTMDYMPGLNTIIFKGPTEVFGRSEDKEYMYCESGWYNTEIDEARISKNALFKGKQKGMIADSIYYDKKRTFTEGFGNLSLTDTANKITIKGNYGWYYEKPEKSMVTDSALLIYKSDSSWFYLHADTLRTHTNDSDSTKKFIAYHSVKFYRNDLQGQCDSLSYAESDSIIRMYETPIIWSETHQITATYIEIFTGKERIDSALLYKTPFIVTEQDSVTFNQMRGKFMTCYFTNNDLSSVLIVGNGETVYFPMNDDSTITSVNKAIGERIKLLLNDREIKKIYFFSEPNATYYPLEQAPSEELVLKGFQWLDALRPKTMMDIFNTQPSKD